MTVLSPANLRRIGQQRRLLIGIVITVVIALVAIIGPLLALYGENDIVGKPFTMEGSWLGTDYLGQDVWSRVLAGGASILLISLLATVLDGARHHHRGGRRLRRRLAGRGDHAAERRRAGLPADPARAARAHRGRPALLGG